jgi:hypothetical protein
VKTQKRPHVVSSNLGWILDEVGLHVKGVISSEATQMPHDLHLILTSTIAFFQAGVAFLHGLESKLPFDY